VRISDRGGTARYYLERFGADRNSVADLGIHRDHVRISDHIDVAKVRVGPGDNDVVIAESRLCGVQFS